MPKPRLFCSRLLLFYYFCGMLGLKLATDPRWVNIAEKSLEEILTDHAFCEQKAATSGISLVIHYSDKEEVVEEVTPLVAEEWGHFRKVLKELKKRGLKLGRQRKDEYVNKLLQLKKKGGSREDALLEDLLICAMIEARSCERFKVLTENIKDEELKVFYRDLMISEANHYTAFIGFARQLGNPEAVNSRWEEWLDYEAEIIKSYGKKESIHG